MRSLGGLFCLGVLIAASGAAGAAGEFFALHGVCACGSAIELVSMSRVSPQSLRWVDGLPFAEIPGSLAVVAGTEVPASKLRCPVEIVADGLPSSTLHVLVQVLFGGPIGQGVEVGRLVVRYTSGLDTTIPLVMGVNVAESEWDRPGRSNERAHEWVEPALVSTLYGGDQSWKRGQFYLGAKLEPEAISAIALEFTYAPSAEAPDRPVLPELWITISGLTLERDLPSSSKGDTYPIPRSR